MGTQDVHKACQLRRLLAARRHHGHHGRDLRLRRIAGKNLLEHLGCLLAGERDAILSQWFQQFLQDTHISQW